MEAQHRVDMEDRYSTVVMGLHLTKNKAGSMEATVSVRARTQYRGEYSS